MKETKVLRGEIIKSKISRVIDSLEMIKENLPNDFDDFNSSKLIKNAIYKETEFAIENILDICAVINSDLRLGMPDAEDNIIDNLKLKKIFNEKTINLILEMKRFRNILVHRYGDIDDKVAFETITEGLEDFDMIIEEVEKLLNKYKSSNNFKKVNRY